jgi:hypothetical protein
MWSMGMTLLERLRRLVFPDPEALDVLVAAERVPDAGRRQFLKLALAGAAVAATVDIEQLLWTPGKTFLLPAEPAWQTFTITHDCSGYEDWNSLPISPELLTEKYIRPAAQHLAQSIDADIARELARIEHEVTFLKRINREYDDRYPKLAIGDTIEIRLPQRFRPGRVDPRDRRVPVRIA